MFINFPEINDLLIQDRDVTIPKMVTIRQHFDACQIADIPPSYQGTDGGECGDTGAF